MPTLPGGDGRGARGAIPDAGFAYTDAWYLDERTRRVRRVSAMGYQRPPEPPPATAADLFDALLERNFIFNAVTRAPQRDRDAVGPPDVRLRSMIDWEWWLRLAATGHRAVRAPGRLAVYRQRPASISKDPTLVVAGQRDLWRLVGRPSTTCPTRRAASSPRAPSASTPSWPRCAAGAASPACCGGCAAAPPRAKAALRAPARLPPRAAARAARRVRRPAVASTRRAAARRGSACRARAAPRARSRRAGCAERSRARSAPRA